MSRETQNNTEKLSSNEYVGEVRYIHFGPMLGILVIALVLVLGGLYLWGSVLVEEEKENTVPRTIENNEPETPRAKADAQILNTVSPSDELGAIEADLESTNLNNLDTELSEIEQELDSALTE